MPPAPLAPQRQGRPTQETWCPKLVPVVLLHKMLFGLVSLCEVLDLRPCPHVLQGEDEGDGVSAVPRSPINPMYLPWTSAARPDIPKNCPAEWAMCTTGEHPFMNANALNVVWLTAWLQNALPLAWSPLTLLCHSSSRPMTASSWQLAIVLSRAAIAPPGHWCASCLCSLWGCPSSCTVPWSPPPPFP